MNRTCVGLCGIDAPNSTVCLCQAQKLEKEPGLAVSISMIQTLWLWAPTQPLAARIDAKAKGPTLVALHGAV